MASKKITAMPDLAGGQVSTDLTTLVDLSAAAANQNVKSTLNDLFSIITKNITDGAVRFQGFAAPSVSAAGAFSIYFDSASNQVKGSQNTAAYTSFLFGTLTQNRVPIPTVVTNVLTNSIIYQNTAGDKIGINESAPVSLLANHNSTGQLTDRGGDGVNVAQGLYWQQAGATTGYAAVFYQSGSATSGSNRSKGVLIDAAGTNANDVKLMVGNVGAHYLAVTGTGNVVVGNTGDYTVSDTYRFKVSGAGNSSATSTGVFFNGAGSRIIEARDDVRVLIGGSPLYTSESGIALTVAGGIGLSSSILSDGIGLAHNPGTTAGVIIAHLDSGANTPIAGGGFRWSDGTAANTAAIYMRAGISVQGSVGAQDAFNVRAATADGSAGAIVFSVSGSTGGTSQASLTLTGSGNNQIFTAATTPASSLTFRWPTADPTASQILTASAPSAGIVTLSWSTTSTPAGSGSELQFRSSASAFGAVTGSSVSGSNVTLTGTLSVAGNGGSSERFGSGATVSSTGGLGIGKDVNVLSAATAAIALGREVLADTANTITIGSANYPIVSLYLGRGRKSATPTASGNISIYATSGDNANETGATLALNPGPPTGTGSSGNVLHQFARPGSSSATIQALSEQMIFGYSANSLNYTAQIKTSTTSFTTAGSRSILWTDTTHASRTAAHTWSLVTNASANIEAMHLGGGVGLTVTPPVRTSGSNTFFKVISPADTTLTASTEAIGVQFGGTTSAATVTRQWATGALTTQREIVCVAPTYGFVGASTLTTAATFAITNAPIAGTNATLTNAYALWVQAGASLFAGQVGLQSSAASAFFVGPNGDTNPMLRVVANVASAAAGLSLTGNAAGAGVTLAVLSSGSNENLRINPKGTGGVGINVDAAMPLHVKCRASTNEGIEVDSNSGAVTSVWYSDGSSLFFGATSNHTVELYANGTSNIRFTATTIGFLSKTPAAQQTGGAATASGTYGATEQTMLQTAYNCLRTFGLLS